ncbi:MAG TPA: hypothetical protein PLX09_14485, partial [Xanthomonadaceae bacterium]|nr:hypothetical protein [Xanthomonadaceae bacterium]
SHRHSVLTDQVDYSRPSSVERVDPSNCHACNQSSISRPRSTSEPDAEGHRYLTLPLNRF